MRAGRLLMPVGIALLGAAIPFLAIPTSAVAVPVAASAAITTAAPAIPSVTSDTSDFAFESFDADYTITRAPDGTSRLSTVETLVAVFPPIDQNRGIIRAIPNLYRNIPLNTSVQSILDERGNAVPYELHYEGEFIELWLGDDSFVHGETTYVISYTQENIVGAFADTNTDEFYWDINGTGWEQPFATVSARVHVGADLVPALTGDASCYAGPQFGQEPCAVSERMDDPAAASTTFRFEDTRLAPGESLTVAIGFAPGTFVQGEEVDPDLYEGGDLFQPIEFTDPPWWSNVLSALTILGGLGLGIGAVVRRVRGGGAKGRGIIIPQYSVPHDLNVMVAAHLVGRPTTAIPAQLVSLAVRHKIRILDYGVTPGGDADYTLQFLASDGTNDHSSDDTDDLEKQLLAVLFGVDPAPGDVRELGRNDTALGSAVNAISSAAATRVTESGLRATAGCLPGVFVLLAFGLIGFSVVNLIAAIAVSSISALPFVGIAAGFLAFIAAVATLQFTGPLTDAGALQRDYLLGMKMYLELAEKERFRLLQSPQGAERVDIGDTKQIIKLYEKLLPFAVIWGVEDQWMHELELKVAATGETPDWFVSSSGFSSTAFTSALRGAASATTYTPPTSSWSSGGSHSSSFGSSFGGSSGGGFSGGGGGGGGGGGR